MTMILLLGSLIVGSPTALAGVVWPDAPLPDVAPEPQPRPKIIAPSAARAAAPAKPKVRSPLELEPVTTGSAPADAPLVDVAPKRRDPRAAVRTAPAAEARPTAAAVTAPPTHVTPTCSGRTADVKEMASKVLDTNVLNLTWHEDVVMRGSPASFRVIDTGGAVRIQMINGSGVSVGVAPARFCVAQENGRAILRVGLQRSALKFGSAMGGLIDVDDEIDQKLARTGNPGEMPLIVSRGSVPGKIRIADGMGGADINSDFTATIGR